MNRDQWQLFLRLNGGWEALWLLTDYETARQHIVASQHGGTGYEPGTCADTTARGLTLTRGWGDDETILVDLPWRAIRAWVDQQTPATISEARRLRTAGHDLQRTYPSSYPTDTPDDQLGHPYAWDRDDATPEEIAADRAWLDGWRQRREVRVQQWHERQRAHQAAISAFLHRLGPDDEPADLLELLEAIA